MLDIIGVEKTFNPGTVNEKRLFVVLTFTSTRGIL